MLSLVERDHEVCLRASHSFCAYCEKSKPVLFSQ